MTSPGWDVQQGGVGQSDSCRERVNVLPHQSMAIPPDGPIFMSLRGFLICKEGVEFEGKI